MLLRKLNTDLSGHAMNEALRLDFCLVNMSQCGRLGMKTKQTLRENNDERWMGQWCEWTPTVRASFLSILRSETLHLSELLHVLLYVLN